MTTITRTTIDGMTALLLAIVLAIAMGLVGLNGVDLPSFSGTPHITGGSPEAITNQLPAYVSEGIVYGEATPADAAGALIMPAYMVETSYFGG